MSFSKENLTGVYTWNTEALARAFEGQPSRRLFDRWNGNQVLFIINQALQSIGNFSMEKGKQLELLIINKLPFDPCSELTVYRWLQKEVTVNTY